MVYGLLRKTPTMPTIAPGRFIIAYTTNVARTVDATMTKGPAPEYQTKAKVSTATAASAVYESC